MFTSTTIEKSPASEAVLLCAWEMSGLRPAGGVSASTSLRDDLDMHSLDMVEMVMDLEDLLGIDIPDEAFENVKTIGDAIAAVDKMLILQGKS